MGARERWSVGTPWVDWANYWATGDASTRYADPLDFLTRHTGPNDRGIDGALMDLEYQRLEPIAFNLHDPNTYEAYVNGRDGQPGAVLKVWPEMRLPAGHREYSAVGGAGEQQCDGELIRHRLGSRQRGRATGRRHHSRGSSRTAASSASLPDAQLRVGRVRLQGTQSGLLEKGAYVLQDFGEPEVILMASGSEVNLILEAAKHFRRGSRRAGGLLPELGIVRGPGGSPS